MRERVIIALLGGLLLCLPVSACNRNKAVHGAPQPPVPPMAGWRVVNLRNDNGTVRATFVPGHRELRGERMWLVIVKDPAIIASSVKDAVEIFRLQSACKKRDLNLLRDKDSDILFVEKDAQCYKHDFVLSIGRIVRASGTVSFIGYRADAESLPDDKQAAIIEYLNAAPFETAPPKEAK